MFVSVQITPAQEQNTPAGMEQLRSRSLWMKSPNAAGAFLDNTREFSTISASYYWLNGDFRRPQQGEDEQKLSVVAEGSKIFQSIYVNGYFDYGREVKKDANFNVSILDPYRGMPYYNMDVVPSEWRNQYYNMGFRVASKPVCNVVSFGVDFDYKAHIGAKQVDLRTENRFYYLNIRPGMVFQLNPHHNIGANFEYYSIKEEAKMDQITSDPMNYYRMKGLGVAHPVQSGVGRTTNWVGNSVGGGVQYYYIGDRVNVMLSGSYSYKVEDAQKDFMNPEDDGTVKDNLWKGELSIYTKGRLSNYFNLYYTDRKIEGIEYIKENQVGVGNVTILSVLRSRFKTQTAGIDYELIANRGEEYAWKAQAGLWYDKKDDKYLHPVSTKKIENFGFSVGGKANFRLSEKFTQRLLVSAAFLGKFNLEGEYDYNGPFPDYPTVTELERLEMLYHKCDHMQFKLGAVYSRSINIKSLSTLFVGADFGYTSTSDNNYNNRTYVKVSVGCNF